MPREQIQQVAEQAIAEKASAIKMMVIGAIVAEYGLLLLGDQRHELKARTNTALAACRSVQSCLLTHPRSTPEIQELLKREFLKDSYVLIADLLTAVWTLREEDLIVIIEEIRKHTEPEPATEPENINVE